MLAGHLGKTVEEIRRDMSMSELLEWFAYYRIEPFGFLRDDLRFALLACVMANGLGNGKRRFTLDDFLLKFEEKKEQSVDEMKQILKRIAERK